MRVNRRTALFLAATLGLWLGIHALRAYLAMSVWNLADSLPLQLKSLLPTGIYGLALLGYPAARLAGQRAFRWFGLGFAVTYALRQWLAEFDLATAIAAFTSFVLFLWWLPSLFERAANSQARLLMPPAAALAISLQVGGQTLLHGLDVPLLRGAGGAIIAMALAVAFGYAILACAAEADGTAEPVGRGILALVGCWLLLQLTLFASPGAVQQITGVGPIGAALLIQFGLAAGVFTTTLNIPISRLLAAVIVLLSAVFAGARGFAGVLLLVLGNASAYVLLAGAFSRGQQARRVFVHGAMLIAGALFFVLLFTYYTRFEAHGLLIVPAILLALLALGSGVEMPAAHRRVLLLIGAVAALTTLGALVPARQPQAGDAAQLTVMTYNVHHGFDAKSLPGMQHIAATIAAEKPDIVLLQEVGRGWNLLGGGDVVAYLRWRFGDYHVVFSPTNGRLWGNAILSRTEIANAESWTFSASEAFRYGVLTGQTAGLNIASVHLSADLDERVDSIRTEQARELIGRLPAARVVIGGDFNAEPGSPAIAQFTRTYTDVPFFFGAGATPTWSDQRLDYVFATPDMQALGARVVASAASDHRPVVVVFKR